MTHDPKAVEVLQGSAANWRRSFDPTDYHGPTLARYQLDALTAADLSIVPEGYGRIGGQVVRLDEVEVYINHGTGYVDVYSDEGHRQYDLSDPLYVAIREDGEG
jgi:hypothetical protein